MSTEPRWAWSSVDDPNPYYPKCDYCQAFARWSICNYEGDDGMTPIVRWFGCGQHVNRALSEGAWWLDAVQVYDLTRPGEPS